MTSAHDVLPSLRGLRGVAQLAGESAAFRVACALEGAFHALTESDITWSSDVRERTELTVGDLDVILSRSEPRDALERRADAAIERWKALGVQPWTPGAGAMASEGQGPGELDDEAFLSFAASEIDGIVTVLGESLAKLAEDPMDREPMKAVLRRQRVLLGAARLDELPIVAETLHAVEDVSRIIGRMNVGIKDEWLDVFRCARVVLEASAEPLARGEDPPHTPALSRLRTYRQELLERYGTDDDPRVAPLSDEVPSEPIPASAPPVGDDVVEVGPAEDIQNLMYTGQAALRRALELRARLERAVEHDPDALALVDEVFDLIRLGLQ